MFGSERKRGLMGPDASRLQLPQELRDVFFDFLWDNQKVWGLPTEPSLAPFEQLAWLLDLPVWTTVPGEVRFDLAPRAVLERPERFPQRWRRILNVDLAHPLELFRSDDGRWVVLDGYHRLARHCVLGSRDVPVRLHPDHCKEQILRD
jgi:hypothetical protein